MTKTQLIAKIKTMAKAGTKYDAIAAALNKDGIKTPHRGKTWSMKTVSQVLLGAGFVKRRSSKRRRSVYKRATGGSNNSGNASYGTVLEIVTSNLNDDVKMAVLRQLLGGSA